MPATRTLIRGRRRLKAPSSGGQRRPTVGNLENALLRERARAAIRNAIAAGTLRPGEQIVEADMAAAIGVSRSPVREALRHLEQQGLVVSIPHRGTFVAELTGEDLEEIVLLRAALEGLAARLAVDRMGRRDLRTLEEIVERMGQLTGPSADDRLRFAEADAEFHSALVRFAEHRRLHRVWSELDPFVWILAVRDPTERQRVDRNAVTEEHRELLDALAAGDPDRAQQAVWHHIVRGLQTLPSRWPPGPSAAPAAAVVHQ